MKRPTISDIAAAAGVSKGAVSYALNGRPGVSATTRAKILAIAEDIGWQPNSAARALSGSRAGAVGLVLARPARLLANEPFFMRLVSGIETALSAAGSSLLLHIVADEHAEVAVYRRWWAQRRVDGVLVIDERVADQRPAALAELGMPHVLLGTEHVGGNVIWHDDKAAMGDLLDYLVALGHRRIGHVAGRTDFRHTVARQEAYADAVRRHGLGWSAEIPTDYSTEQGAAAVRRLLTRPDAPTAIVLDNDVMAIATLGVADEMGLVVPRDLSVVAWDDSPLCRVVRPALTALGRDIEEFGARAAHRLLESLDTGEVACLKDPTAQLVVRGSTCRPR